jgi:hypothetical protein
VANAIHERRQIDRHALWIDVPAGAHGEIDAVESKRLQRPGELARVHPGQMLRKEAQCAAEARPALSERQRVDGCKPESCRTRCSLNETASVHETLPCLSERLSSEDYQTSGIFSIP